MDFLRLGKAYTSDYVPDELIEGYNSLIWTERFLDPGEFELKTFDINGVAKLLPEDTLVSHSETREVMLVETHEINLVGEGADAQPELTVRGRSATSILDSRWVESDYQKKRRMRKRYSATAAAAVLLYNAIDNASTFDVTRGDDDPDTEGVVNSYPWTDKDVLPNIAITDSAVDGGTRWWQLEQGVLWPQLQKILFDADLGLRCLRPIPGLSPGLVVTVKSALAERGTVVRTDIPDIKSLQFNIYSGIDRSSSVQLSQLQGHLDKPQYLTSVKDYKTALEVMSGEINMSDVFLPGAAGFTGWRRKVMGFDAGTPEIPKEPERPKDLKSNATKGERASYNKALDDWIDKHAKWKNKRDRIVDDFKEEQGKAALRALKAKRRVDMFSGDISTLSPYTYKTHYDLGDTVMLNGDYGKSAKMIVSEYVRTDDASGDRGFPGLVAP